MSDVLLVTMKTITVFELFCLSLMVLVEGVEDKIELDYCSSGVPKEINCNCHVLLLISHEVYPNGPTPVRSVTSHWFGNPS